MSEEKKILHQDEKYTVSQRGDLRVLESPVYNYVFNTKDGTMLEWGATLEENPNGCPFGPTILDIEVTTICRGPNGIPCPACYKANTACGTNMTLDTFKKVMSKMPATICQVAYGCDAQAESNPDLFEMMKHCRSLGMVPNVTVADITQETAAKLVENCGAVAVSAYKHARNFQTCYDSIDMLVKEVFKQRFHGQRHPGEVDRKEFIEKGMQLNVHYLLQESSAADAIRVMEDMLTDPRLQYVNAIVFLMLKNKGRGADKERVSEASYNRVIDFALIHNIAIGFDTCGAGKFLKYSDAHKEDWWAKEISLDSVEHCCAGRFSAYINELGEYSPCSFLENTQGAWEKGLSVLECNSFDEIWQHPKVREFAGKAETCGACKSGCPHWEV